jgi:dihydroneopterin aldolase
MDSDQFLLRIDALALDASIGIYPQERAQRQLVLADLELVFSAVSAAWSDEISHTIDYDEVLACVNELIASRHFNLLETLAQRMLDVVQERFPVERMMVTLSKPAASGSTRRISVTKAMAPRKIRRWGRTTRQVLCTADAEASAWQARSAVHLLFRRFGCNFVGWIVLFFFSGFGKHDLDRRFLRLAKP